MAAEPRIFVGVDVGADRLHCVALDGLRPLDGPAVFGARELPQLAAWAAAARAVSIDAPAQLSTAPHHGDPSLSPKFALARCAEITLGREHGSWVPWVTPTAPPVPGWMATGFAAYDALRGCGIEPIEVFPHAGFRALVQGARLPKKRTIEGRRARVDALRRAGVETDNVRSWSHDAVDALVAALIARGYDAGTAVAVTCGHDASAIWLPGPPSQPESSISAGSSTGARPSASSVATLRSK
jgi:predicted nuclease with RNAse H fold